MDQQNRPVEIKDLNKTQLILLAILLSFVVSIATGIVTVTLMQQASVGTTQTINRVVQQTIEKVVPDYSPGKVQTVIVKEDDLVVDAVKKTRANLTSVFADKDSKESIADAYSLGNGIFLVQSAPIDSTHTYIVKEGASQFELKGTSTSPLGFSLMTVTTPNTVVKDLPKALFGKDTDIRIGQTAVLVTRERVRKGIVQTVMSQSLPDGTPSGTNILLLDPVPDVSMLGAYVVNLEGDVVGIVLPKGEQGLQIIGIDAVTKSLAP